MSSNGTALATERIAISLPEARLDHGLSQRELSRLSGVSATSIRKLEAGRQIDPALVLRIAATLVVLDVFRPPSFEDDLDALLHRGREAAAAA